ncbi:FeoB-associated Cys-rich membrane protein [Rossellomorea aquimaris]|uniref:FeoB-associated Cys-rich membrane protein n=1 Tax=Rossellomorea TaxID=2837508 RepID=UPI001CD29B2D|nr:FeoB-associated Cys-rich membrane protein [Rossellomorea aquimaris]MCA1061787.1 FeoB-associated Cys-rich membrane protein [Rossellomorea aquimaris]
MIVSIVLGLLIFGYASWMVFAFFKKSRQGKCGTCALNKTCKSGCATVSPDQRQNVLKN